MAEPPQGAHELTYIESNGTQYIDTGYTGLTGSDRVVIEVEQFQPTSALTYLFGVSIRNRLINFASRDNSYMAEFYQTRATFPSTISYPDSYTVTITKSTVAIRYSNETRTQSLSSSFAGSFLVSPFIFASRYDSSGTPTGLCSARIKSLTIQDSHQQPKFELIAYEDPNGVACMFSPTTGRFYYNQGTGNFIKGSYLDDVPNQPTDVIIEQVGKTNVSFSWAEQQEAEGYKIYRDDTLVSTQTGNSYYDAELSQGTDYTYKIVAYNYVGDSIPYELSITTLVDTVPPRPTVSYSIVQVDDTMEVHISYESTDTLRYRIEKNGESIYEGTNTSVVDTELIPYIAYTYDVYAINAIGDSEAESVVVSINSSNPLLWLIFDRTDEDVTKLQALKTKGWNGMTLDEKLDFLFLFQRGSYEFTDLNRVESACDYLCKLLVSTELSLELYADTMGVGWDAKMYPPYNYHDYLHLNIKTNWVEDDYPNNMTPQEFKDNLERYLNNVKKVRESFNYVTSGLPTTMNNLTVLSANAIEKVLYDLQPVIQQHEIKIRALIDRISSIFVYSNEIYGGEI